MVVMRKEEVLEKINRKLSEIKTSPNKISYIESILKEENFDLEIKRFLLKELSDLYFDRKMFEKSARSISKRATIEISNKERIESYLSAGEIYSRAGKIEDAEEMFVRAMRDSDVNQKERIKLTRKNIYLVLAKDLEGKGKKASATKFYEKLIKLNLEEIEKKEIKERLIEIYKSLGLFREARLVEGL